MAIMFLHINAIAPYAHHATIVVDKLFYGSGTDTKRCCGALRIERRSQHIHLTGTLQCRQCDGLPHAAHSIFLAYAAISHGKRYAIGFQFAAQQFCRKSLFNVSIATTLIGAHHIHIIIEAHRHRLRCLFTNCRCR